MFPAVFQNHKRGIGGSASRIPLKLTELPASLLKMVFLTSGVGVLNGGFFVRVVLNHGNNLTQKRLFVKGFSEKTYSQTIHKKSLHCE
jgi:hypothetical protein